MPHCFPWLTKHITAFELRNWKYNTVFLVAEAVLALVLAFTASSPDRRPTYLPVHFGIFATIRSATTLFNFPQYIDAFDIVKQSTIVAVEFGKLAFRLDDTYNSRWGACMMAMFVCASTFAAALSSMVTSSEIIVLSANRGFLPSVFAVSKNGSAINAYLMQGFLAAGLLLPLVVSPSGADSLMTFYSFPTWLFYASCVLVLIALRFREPELARPYKVLPTTPALFLLACGLLVSFTTYGNPGPVFASIALTLVGIPVFWYRARQHPRLMHH